MRDIELLEVYRHACETLDQKVGEFHAKFHDQIQCKKGCSSCCENAQFRIRLIEAKNLMQAYNQASTAIRQSIEHNLLLPATGHEQDCPLLVEGACVLYDARPALCRAYGTLVRLKDNVSTCKLNFNHVPDELALDVVDIEPVYELLDELSARVWKASPFSETTPPPVFTVREFFTASLGPVTY